VQSSVALLEKQRNPGVGYWSSVSQRTDEEVNGSAPSRTSMSSDRSLPSQNTSPGEQENKTEEEVNLEYLRNVILQFNSKHIAGKSCPGVVYHPQVYSAGNATADGKSLASLASHGVSKLTYMLGKHPESLSGTEHALDCYVMPMG